MKDKEKIEEKDKLYILNTILQEVKPLKLREKIYWRIVEFINKKLPKDSIVLSMVEYERLKSLYDSQQGAYMTSSIGDLPLTVEGLRKAVDEITRLIGVQIELQELNVKYYNEAKDLRRKSKEAQETSNCKAL